MSKDYAKFVPERMEMSPNGSGRWGVVLFAIFVLGISIAISYFLYEKKVSHIPGEKPSIPGFFSYALSSVLHHDKKISHPVNTAKKIIAQNNKPEVEFDFYNELPNEQMTVTEDETTKQQIVKIAPSSENLVPKEEVSTAAANTPPATVSKTLFDEEEVSKQLMAEVSKSPEMVVPDKTINKPVENAALNVNLTQKSINTYVLQLGTFEIKEGALRLKEALEMVGVNTQVIEKQDNHKKMYEVQQGPFASSELAQLSQRELQKRGIESTITPCKNDS